MWCLFAALCTFIPPSQWELAQLKTPSPHIQIGFMGKGSGGFRPSLSLAIEEVDVGLKDYVKAVKKLYGAESQAQWRDLGPFSTRAGEARLIEVTTATAWGDTKTLQVLFVQEGKAYILTAALLKSQWPQYQNELLQSFRSLSFVADLASSIPDRAQKEAFTALFATLGKSGDKEMEKRRLEEIVATNAQLGAYWQYLVLREGLKQIGKEKK
jgi:hypothetical protein